MFKRHKWIAVVRGNHWVVAKVSQRNQKLKVLRLAELKLDPEKKYPDTTPDAIHREWLTEDVQLKKWLSKQKVPSKQLQLAIYCPGVITRIITLPIMSTKDLDRLLTEQVDQYFTLNVADYIIDYRVLDYFEENGQELQRVLLTALPRLFWESMWSLWESVGLKPKVVDFAADSLTRLYSQLMIQGKKNSAPRLKLNFLKRSNRANRANTKGGVNQNRINQKMNASQDLAESVRRLSTGFTKLFKNKRSKTLYSDQQIPDIAIIDLGSDRVEVILLERGVFFLYSEHEQEIYFSDLRSLKPMLLSGLMEPKAARNSNSESPIDTYHQEIENVLNPLFQTLSGFFSFFAARHFGKSIDTIFLTGDYADLPFLEEVFVSNLEVDTKVGFPANWRPYFNKRLGMNEGRWIKYGSLYGFAMRED